MPSRLAMPTALVLLLQACSGTTPLMNDPTRFGDPAPVQLVITDAPLNLAIEGGVRDVSLPASEPAVDFFVVTLPDGTHGYTRRGEFKLGPTGSLLSERGFPIFPPLVIPADTTDIHVREDGLVLVRSPDTQEQEDVGVILLARFPNPRALQSAGHGLFSATPASGPASLGRPATNGRGMLKQGMLDQAEQDNHQS